MSRLLTQLLIVVMLRTQHIPIIQSSPGKLLSATLLIMGTIGLSLPYIPPLAQALQMEHPHPTFYGFLCAILLSYILLVQVVKTIYRRIYKEWM
jgi:P-type Mg2+ transporter